MDDTARLGPPRSDEVNISVGIHVPDVDEVYERAKGFGARILHEPETYRFGERQFTAVDLEGFRWDSPNLWPMSLLSTGAHKFQAHHGEPAQRQDSYLRATAA